MSEVLEMPQVRPSRKGLTISWAHVVTLVGVLLSVGAAWQANHSDNATNRAEIARVEAETHEHFQKNDTTIQSLVTSGNPDQERRIKALEDQKADRLAVIVQQIADTVKTQAEAQKNDHDSIVKMSTLLETQLKTKDASQ